MATMLDPANLKALTQWIRDSLDPSIARDGPEAISVEDALYIDQVLRKLLLATLSIQDIRSSRIHLALLEIAGRSTRWPHRLIERAEAIIKAWEAKIGCLTEIGIELLGPGGRLEGVVTLQMLATDSLLVSWLKSSERLLPVRARRRGDLTFTSGQWWINALFAFRDGIIDSPDANGGITCDSHGAYAIVLADEDEMAGESPNAFTYRAHPRDKGRYRLTAATRESRQPVRILRSHSLKSFWRPRAGIRYDGLYHAVGWTIKQIPSTRSVDYLINFVRLTTQPSIDAALLRPSVDELEDYFEYKRLRRVAAIKPSKLAKMGIPTSMLPVDGAQETESPSVTRCVCADTQTTDNAVAERVQRVDSGGCSTTAIASHGASQAG